MFNKSAKPQSGITPASVAPQPTMEPPIVETPQPTVSKQSSQKLLLVVSGAVLLFAVAAGLFLMNQKPPMDDPTPIANATPQPTEEPTACTMDAKICPDGSSVGRVAPSCEFEACPGEGDATKKTYEDERLSFTYPAGWVVKEDGGFIQVYEDQENADLGGVNYFMSISVVDAETINVQKFLDEPVGTRTEEGDQIFVTKLKDLTISGNLAVMTGTEVGAGSATDASPGWTVYIKDGSKVIDIGMRKYSTVGTEENFIAVINSFKVN